MVKPLLKLAVKTATKQGGEEVLEQTAKRAVRQAPSPNLIPKVTSGVELDESLFDNQYWLDSPPEMKKVYKSLADRDPTGDLGNTLNREFTLANADDQAAQAALNARFTDKFATDAVNEIPNAQRVVRAAAEGRVLEAPKETFAPTISDDLNYLEKGVDYTDELAQFEKNRALAEKGMEKALAKPDGKFSEDLLNRITTIAGLPGQVKKWLKKAAQKAKAGIPFEEGDPIFDEMGEFIGSSIEGMTFQELHHELMKAVYSAYVDTAAKLAKSGSGNTMDILNLNHMAKSYGFGMGDFGVEGYPRVSHSWAHTELIKEGVQKSGQALKDQVQAITELPNMQTLTQDFKRSLEELAVPMRRKMDLGKRAYKKLPEIDRIKVHQLKSAKDNLKNDLKELMIGEFQQAGLPIPSSGGGVDFFKAFKKAGGKPSQEAIELDKAIKLTRKEAQALNEKLKKAIGPIVEKDVELDVKEMEELIDMHFEGITDADTMTREWALKMGSIREAKIKADQKLAAEAYTEPAVEPKTIEEARANMAAIKAGTLHYPGQIRK